MKTISLFATVIISLSLSLFSCTNSSAANQKNAESDVRATNQDLEITNQEYLDDIENYRSEVRTSIAHNDSLIASHKNEMKKRGLTTNPFYKSEIENLEAQNNALKEKMDNYQGEGQDKWATFKKEFTRDMDELRSSLDNLTVKNRK